MTTPSGAQPIATLQVGQQVQAYDPTTGKVTTQTIQQVWLNHDSNRLDVTLAVQTAPATTAAQDASSARTQQRQVASHGRRGPPDATTAATTPATTATATTQEVVHTTANHPWLSADHGWLLAGALRVGEPVRLLDGATATVVALRTLPGVGPMWDLSLDAVHTFAVGDTQAVVHNTNCGNVDFSSSRAQRNIDHEYDRHGVQWAMSANRNTAAKAAFVQKLENHIDDPDTVAISGWFGKPGMSGSGPATHFYNPNTDMNVFAHSDGTFWGAWKLSPAQASSLLTSGGFW